MSPETHLRVLVETLRTLAVVLGLGVLSYAAMEVGYTDAMVFFGVAAAVVAFLFAGQYRTELHKRAHQ